MKDSVDRRESESYRDKQGPISFIRAIIMSDPTPAGNASTNITESPAAPASTGITNLPTAPAPMPSTIVTGPAPIPAPPPPTGPVPVPAWLFQADCALLLLVFVLSFLLASFAAANSDIWLNVAIGQRLSEGTFQFGVDPFSWATAATADKPAVFWVDQSWLFSFLFFHLYNLVGGAGLVIGKAILFTAAIGLLSRIGWTEANRWFVIVCLTLAALAISPRLLLDSTVVSFFFLALTMFILDRAGVFLLASATPKPPCPRVLWGLPPLFALWANLDPWFILGPLTLGLCWAAVGFRRWDKDSGTVPGKLLGIVFGVGVLACLVNPYHVRVFQLPPELAYIVISMAEPLKIPLPNDLVAGGRTLKELRRFDVNLPLTMSPLTPLYWREVGFGWNIAGLAIVPLFALGLIGFTLAGLIRAQAGAPTLQISRFLIWLVFAVLALTLHRLIPFFAIVAAPLAALTLGEFVRWQQVSNPVPGGRGDRGMHMARLLSIPFLLLLLYMAWPGWLHGPTEYNSLRRVDWQIRESQSLRRAAETLQELKKKGECKNVFNSTTDLAHYCAWFAPDVKCFLDQRHALFPEWASTFIKTRDALLTDARAQAEDWQPLFEERQIDQVALANTKKNTEVQLRFQVDDQWRERGVDNRNILFSWAGAGRRWPGNTSTDDLNRLAFGTVPADRRSPLHGTSAPEPLNFWALYSKGIGPQPAGLAEFVLYRDRYNRISMIAQQELGMRLPWIFVGLAPSLGSASLPPGVPEWFRLIRTDIPPAALPILMVRATREAVGENPLDLTSQLTLGEANEARAAWKIAGFSPMRRARCATGCGSFNSSRANIGPRCCRRAIPKIPSTDTSN